MVTTPLPNRKYLCAAPRPESWEDYAISVLKHLGDKAAAIEQLKATLEKARTLNPIREKNGPGRKSNAEHAIHFYEFLLDRLEFGPQGRKDKEDATEKNIDSDGSVEKESGGGSKRAEKLAEDDSSDGKDENTCTEEVKNSPKSNLEEPKGNDEGAGNDDKGSVDSEEQWFSEQHNDVCEVCDDAGELLMCSTCNLVFHLHCLRPALTEMPEDQNWRCSYCLLQHEPKKSPSRKQAAKAVRLMARLRKQLKREKNEQPTGEQEIQDKSKEINLAGHQESEEEEKDSEKVMSFAGAIEAESRSSPAAEVQSTPGEDKNVSDFAVNQKMISANDENLNCKNDDQPDAEKKENVSKNEEDKQKEKPKVIQSEELENLGKDSISRKRTIDMNEFIWTPQTRAKRIRKQPTLFDPQICPASSWKSDEFQDWRSPSQPGKNGDSDEEKEKCYASYGTDDENVEEPRSERKAMREKGGEIWCGFCKDDPAIQICCFCACRVCFGKHNQSMLLLCDQCDEEYHTFCLNPPLASVPSARKWYCPSCKQAKKNKNAKIATRCVSKSVASPINSSKIGTPSPTRASTRKVVLSHKTSEEPKAKPKGGAKLPKDASDSEGRKRGRPPSIVNDASTPRKRGRPSKASKTLPQTSEQSSESTTCSASNSNEEQKALAGFKPTPFISRIVPGVPQPGTVSRSGRTVKRTNFHDEIDEGEQHLRSQRLTQETNRKVCGDTAASSKQLPKVTHEIEPEPSKAKAKAKSNVKSAEGKNARDKPLKDAKELNFDAVRKSIETETESRKNDDTKSFPMNTARPKLSQVDKKPDIPTTENLPSLTKLHVDVENKTAGQENAEIKPVETKLEVVKQPSIAENTVSENPVGSQPPETKFVASEEAKLSSAGIELPIPPAKLPAAPAAVMKPAEKHLTVHEPKVPQSTAPSPPSTMMQTQGDEQKPQTKVPRRKPGARECMQISRRFGVCEIPQKYMDILTDYCARGKVEHLIRMRERLDDHSRFLEAQLAGLEALVKQNGESEITVPTASQMSKTKSP